MSWMKVMVQQSNLTISSSSVSLVVEELWGSVAFGSSVSHNAIEYLLFLIGQWFAVVNRFGMRHAFHF